MNHLWYLLQWITFLILQKVTNLLIVMIIMFNIYLLHSVHWGSQVQLNQNFDVKTHNSVLLGVSFKLLVTFLEFLSCHNFDSLISQCRLLRKDAVVSVNR